MNENKNQRPIKVAICIPSGDMLHADFAMSLVNLVSYSRGLGLHLAIINTKTSHIDIGRHMMVKTALQAGVDYVLFLDSDMVFPANTLERLLGHQKDIVGGAYVRRRPPHDLVVKFLDHADISANVCEVARIPTGCMLVNAGVFAKVPEPWFDSRWNPKSQERISEDNAFCDDARRMGLQVFLDQELTHALGHIGSQTFYVTHNPGAAA